MSETPVRYKEYIRSLKKDSQDLVQHPLKVAPRSGSLKTYPDVYFFDPISWENVSLMCPMGHGALKAKETFADFGKKPPRLIYGQSKNFWLVSRLLKCSKCKSPYLSHDQSIISQLPKDIVLDFVLFHSSGYTRSLLNDVVTQAANGACFSKIYNVLQERKKSAICDAIYKSNNLAEKIVKHLESPGFKCPKVNQLEDCFLYFFKTIQQDIVEELKSVQSKYLSVDHTYSVA